MQRQINEGEVTEGNRNEDNLIYCTHHQIPQLEGEVLERRGEVVLGRSFWKLPHNEANVRKQKRIVVDKAYYLQMNGLMVLPQDLYMTPKNS